MGFIGFLILGLIAGAIAKAIMPGRQGGGLIATLILGVVGALLGGWLSGLIFHEDLIRNFWSPVTWITAIIGSLIVLFIWGLVTKRRI
ncbi:GlsB/YeaQ/YmgE family stress response membrane protein [Sinomonas sp. JGH33]|uniref:GlsB/YeaQ/YmgE family stress response membrane protein n=1 Tax=Sinomonas terricola TaxID=3110330 RepID=A0ABU5T147_9MICC|nr:GlsB/YeaQ/YmgE family stress response membrane protein [Sinomonas sp. JGH33]MEA5453382.1 GlsB/YeaQ/YmgE family stress response membrane protein [Sinomonas sp. JGH33]